MKYDRTEQKMDVVGELVAKKMTIKDDDGKMFSMLVDSLYSDKYGSVVRELATNALDSHRQANNMNTPYEIHLPTDVNTKFRIRDYGIGLSKDNLIKLFTELLSTTKDTENQSVGYYGIGCKSPFSVTDEFLVTSYYKQRKTTVMFSRQGKKVPEYFVLSEEETDQPSGVEISFDSNPNDDNKWINAIEIQLSQFELKPNVFVDKKLFKIDYYLPYHKYGIDYFMGNRNLLYVEMGGVLYPCTDIYDEKLKEVSVFHRITPIIHVPIGSIDVPPSRETIEFTPKTIQTLYDTILQLKKNVLKNIEHTFNHEFQDNYKFQTNLINDYYHFLDYFNFERDDYEVPFQYKTNIAEINDIDLNGLCLGYQDTVISSEKLKTFNLTQKLKHNLKVKVHGYRNGELFSSCERSIKDILTLNGKIHVCHYGNKALAHQSRDNSIYYTVTGLKGDYLNLYNILKTFASFFQRDNIHLIEKELPKRDKIPNKVKGIYTDAYRSRHISESKMEDVIENPKNYLYAIVNTKGMRTSYYDTLKEFNVLSVPKELIFVTPSKASWLRGKGVEEMNEFTFNLSLDDLELEKTLDLVVDNYSRSSSNDNCISQIWELLMKLDNALDLFTDKIKVNFNQYLKNAIEKNETIYGFLQTLGLVSLSKSTNTMMTYIFDNLGHELNDVSVQNILQTHYVESKLNDLKGRN